LDKDIIYHEMTGVDFVKEAKDRGLSSGDEKSWTELKGMTEDSTEVTVIERLYKLNLHKRKKYRYAPEAGEDPGKEIIVTAPGPEKLIEGGGYSIDFALSVVGDKYEYHTPLERQTREMEAHGLKGVDTKQLYNLARAVSVHMEPVLPLIRRDIFSAGVAVHCDETPWHIYGKDDDGYMWVMSNQAGGVYRFEPTRSGHVAREMLKGYTGPVLTDGYSGYSRLKKVKGVTVSHCWSHARRRFYDIRELYPEETEQILKIMKDLFGVEHEAKDYGELKRLRREQSEPLVEEIKTWMLANISKHLPESPFTKAIKYSLKHWDGLKAFLYDVRIPLTNNDAERAVRHAVMGRKNFYGSRTIDGADVASILYTVIESCKRVELNPTSYMKQVILHNNRGEAVESPLEYARRIRTKKIAA
jgi:transposase